MTRRNDELRGKFDWFDAPLPKLRAVSRSMDWTNVRPKRLESGSAAHVRAFLRQANGGELTERRPEGDSTLTFPSCRDMVAATQELRALLADVGAEPADTFVAVMDYEDGDVLTIDARHGRGTVVNGWHDEINTWHTKAPLARSFTAFADMLLSTVESGKSHEVLARVTLLARRRLAP
jgi:hypothetical protein